MRAGSPRFFLAISLLGLAVLWSQFLVGTDQAMARRTFVEFPLTIGGWDGRELGLDEEVLEALRMDDYMMRLYTNAEKTPVAFYVGYYSSLSQEAYHSPKYCLPGGLADCPPARGGHPAGLGAGNLEGELSDPPEGGRSTALPLLVPGPWPEHHE